MRESVANLLPAEEAEKIPHMTPGSLRSTCNFYIPDLSEAITLV